MARGLLGGALLLASLASWATPAGAQIPGSCPTGGLSLARVDIDSPADGATLTAGSQRVSGSVVSGITRVELYVDGVLSDTEQLSSGDAYYSLGWQAAATIPHSSTVRVVGCGTGLGQLLRGEAEVGVRITPAVATTRPSPTSTEAPGPTTVHPTTTAVTPTTVKGQAATAASSSTTAVTTTTPAPVQAPVAGPPGTTATRPASQPLVLSERPKKRGPGPPLWVGAVVGVSGTIGLGLSALLSRRSAARAAQHRLPVEDLHDEGSDLVSF